MAPARCSDRPGVRNACFAGLTCRCLRLVVCMIARVDAVKVPHDQERCRYYRGGQIVPRRERPRRSTAAQANDPYTLVVALDAQQAAVGSLYIDDGASYDFLQGSYIQAELSFHDGVLKYHPTHTGLAYSQTFERVVILGYAHAAPGAAYTAESVEAALAREGVRGDEGAGSWDRSVLGVRSPDTPVQHAWSLRIAAR